MIGGVLKFHTRYSDMELLGKEVDMHKYTVQITVADSRDGACSSSTLKEASSGENRCN